MKFLVAFLALVAYAAAVYVTPVYHTAYASPVVHHSHSVAYPLVHYRARRQLYTYTPVVHSYYPLTHVHYRQRRQLYTPVLTTGVHYHYPYHAVYYRQRRDAQKTQQ